MTKEFSQILVEKGVITPDQAHIALLEQVKQERTLTEILIELHFADTKIISEIYSDYLGYPYTDVQSKIIDTNLINNFGIQNCITHSCIPFAQDDELHVALSDPENIVIKDFIKKDTHEFFTKNPKWKFYYSDPKTINDTILKIMKPDSEGPDAPFEKLFNSLFRNSALDNASDIHFIPHEKMVEVKTRSNGKLETYTRLEWPIYNKFIVKIKILSKLDIAEKRTPQSGGCLLILEEQKIDCRISVHPTLWGESIVVRLLATNRKALKLEELGFSLRQIKELQQILFKPFGLFLVSGATGSGKTTTLHALLQEMDKTGLNIMTLEQPIEYRIMGVRQTEIKEESGMTFADGIRSMLRHDPDVLLIGEIRDEDTAKMALRAAMTGHLVLATIHSSTAYTAPARLIDLGIKPSILAGQIIGVLDQKLVNNAEQNTRKATGEVIIFNDAMHQIVGDGGNPFLLKQAYGS